MMGAGPRQGRQKDGGAGVGLDREVDEHRAAASNQLLHMSIPMLAHIVAQNHRVLLPESVVSQHWAQVVAHPGHETVTIDTKVHYATCMGQEAILVTGRDQGNQDGIREQFGDAKTLPLHTVSAPEHHFVSEGDTESVCCSNHLLCTRERGAGLGLTCSCGTHQTTGTCGAGMLRCT
eukprot:1652714-Rhodomonas_salina.2